MTRVLALILLTLLPSLAWGADFLEWDSAGNDKSIYYLGQVFGQVGVVLLGDGSPLFAELFKVFNIVVLTLGSVVVAYSVLTATIESAAKGEVMGQKWSSVWIPFKAALGLSLLVPGGSGYSIVQIIITWIILQGVHGANQLWYRVLETISSGQSVTSSFEVEKTALKKLSINMFQAAVCMYELNTNEDYQNILGEEVEIYRSDEVFDELWIGVPGSNQYGKVCGTVKAGTKHTDATNENQWIGKQLDGAELAFIFFDNYAEEAVVYKNDRGQWSGDSIIAGGANAIKGQVVNVDVRPDGGMAKILAVLGMSGGLNEVLELARQDGWIHAGIYYFILAASSGNKTFQPPVFTPPKQYPPGGDWMSSWEKNLVPLANSYLKTSEILPAGADFNTLSIMSDPPGLKSEAKAALQGTGGTLSGIVQTWIYNLSQSNDNVLQSMKSFGLKIMRDVEIAFWVLVIVVPLIMIIACLIANFNPGCYIMGTVVVLLLPIVSIILTLLWSVGVLLGLYVPMIPMLVFTFTALGWLILCIESLVASPIVALGLASPGQDVLGKAAPAVMIMTNVFLRPSLMIISFIASVRILQPVVGMINYGFEQFAIVNVGNLLVFGNIVLVVIYAGIIIGVIHQVFSMVYKIPDAITKWIGGQVEQSQVEQNVEKVKGYSDKGQAATSGLMKGGMGFATKMAKSSSAGSGPGGGGAGLQS